MDHINEELVGEALAPLRNEVVIATKFGSDIQNGKNERFRKKKIFISPNAGLNEKNGHECYHLPIQQLFSSF
jgi:aryl-alcohol dehydrogenase-like predicted oxidoreductase